MRISLSFELELGGKTVAFSRNFGAVTAPRVGFDTTDEVLARALKEAPDAVKAIAGCANAREAYMYCVRNKVPELPCSPEELFYRTKPLHMRPPAWQDDPI